MSEQWDSHVHILHVDDDSSFRELTVRFLEDQMARFRVETATSAQEGLELLEETEYDCLVSDYDMPGTDGLEFLEAVRDRHGTLPFILYTGKGSEEIASEAISRGVTDYLQKGSGAEQYKLLANRIENAVEQYQATRRADELERIRGVIADVTQTLVRAETRTDIEHRVCEIISDAEPYQFVWIGEHDSDARTVEPRVAAGDAAGYLEDIDITTDEQDTAQGPTGRAVRTQELVVMQNILENPDYEPWREDALERGYRSSAAIPLVYDGMLYGVLNVYADRTYAFDEQERTLLKELADDIAHALHRTEVWTHLQRTERIIENLPVGVYRSTPTGELVDVNATLVEIFDAESRDDLLEHDASDFYRNSDQRETLRNQLQTEDFVRDHELRQETLTGDDIWVSATAIRTEEDGEVYFDGIIQDITEHKQREHELQRSLDFLERTGEIADTGGWELDVTADKLRWTSGTRQLHEVGSAFEPTLDDAIEFYHPDDRDEIRNAIEHAIEAGESFDATLRLITETGRRRWVRVRGEPHRRDGETVRIRGVIVDVTDLKEQE